MLDPTLRVQWCPRCMVYSAGCHGSIAWVTLSLWRLLSAKEIDVLQVGKGKVVKVTGIENPGRSATVLLRGSNKLVLEVTIPGHSATASHAYLH